LDVLPRHSFIAGWSLLLAEQLQQDGLKVWFDEWELPVAATRRSAANSQPDQASDQEEDGGTLPRRSSAGKIEEGLEHSHVLMHRMLAHALGSDWPQLEASMRGRGNLPFRDR